MIDEVPNLALYIMGAMARRIRSIGQAMSGRFAAKAYRNGRCWPEWQDLAMGLLAFENAHVL
jgi:hypothetical protein